LEGEAQNQRLTGRSLFRRRKSALDRSVTEEEEEEEEEEKQKQNQKKQKQKQKQKKPFSENK